MSDVDDRIVSIQFDNENFERKIAETIKNLDALNKSLQMTGATQGLSEISAAANRFDTSKMASAVENISNKFSALGAVGFTVIQKLTEGVLGFAKSGVDKILDPILSGGKSRAENIEQAKFMFEGIGIDVAKGMESAKQAVLGTAFGLDAAAKVAAQFGASGIAAGDQMTGALRGVAGAAAMTGSSFSEIGDIFAGVAGQGKLTNQDLLQFATRGLNAAAAIGKVMGKSEAQIHEMARNGQIDFKTFADAMDKAFGKHATEANKTYAGSLANLHAALSRLGAAFFTPFLEDQRNIFNSLSPAVDKVAKSMDPLVKVFTSLTKVSSDKLVKFIDHIDFTKLNVPMKAFADGIKNLADDVSRFIAPIKAAFKQIFPGDLIGLLRNIASLFREVTDQLRISSETANKIKHSFAGFFAILSIGFTVIKELGQFIFKLATSLFPAGTGFLNLTAKIGDFFVRIQEVLVKGGGIHDFFTHLGVVIQGPVKFIQELAKTIGDFFNSSIDNDKLSTDFGRIGQRIDQLSSIWDRFAKRFDVIKEALNKVWDFVSDFFSSLGQKLAEAFKPGDFDNAVDLINVGLLGGLTLAFQQFFSKGILVGLGRDLSSSVSRMFAGLTNSLKAMQAELKAEGLMKIAIAIGILSASLLVLSLIDSKKLTQALFALTISFAELIGAMTAMDKLVGSSTAAIKLGIIGTALIEFATAAVILTGAVALMATLNWDEITRGLTGIAIGLALLVATAKILSDTGVFGAAGAALAGAAMIEMATALAILAGVIKIFATMSWEDISKGMEAVAIGLGLMVLSLKILDAGVLGGAGAALAGAGMILMATALNILAGAVKIFATMSIEDLAKGLVAVGAGLLIIAGVMKLMPLSLPITAAGMLILAIALNVLAGAVAIMGHMDLGTLAKGIGAFAIMLGILVLGVNAMSGALAGAAALIVVAAAMAILAGVLAKIAGIKIEDILKALLTMAAVIGLFAGLSVLLSAAITPMLGLGVALIAIGAGFALLGGGLFLLGKGLESIARSGVAGAEALVKVMSTIGRGMLVSITKVLEDLLNSIPLLMRLLEAVLSQLLDTIIKLAPKLGKALIVLFTEGLKALRTIYPQLVQTGIELLLALLNGIANNIDKVIEAAVDIVVNLVKGIVDNIPRLVDAVSQLIGAFLGGIAQYAEQLVETGLKILLNILLGISDNISKVIDTVTSIILQILSTIAADEQMLIDAGFQILTSFILGITNNIINLINTIRSVIIAIISTIANDIQQIVDAGTSILVNLMLGITNNIQKVIDTVGSIITQIITSLGDNASRIVTAGSDALIHFLEGLGAKIPKLAETATTVIVNFMEALGREIPRFAQAGFDMMVSLLDGIAEAIRKNSERMGRAMANLAESLLHGFGSAFKAALIKFAKDELGPLGNVIVDTFNGIFDNHSPSKVFMKIGDNVAEGFTIGMTRGFGKSANAAAVGGEAVINSMSNTISRISDSLGELGEFNPTITPVLDLTKVQLEATKIDGLMKISAITPQVSTQTANQIATTTSLGTQDAAVTAPTLQEVKFEQNNYSPEALSVNDIYRNTKNQIALAKEELDIS